MTEKEWDEDLEDLLRGLMLKGYLKGKIQADNPKKYTLDTNKAKREYKIIKNHYKHQKSEILKRVPGENEIYEKLKKEIKDIQNPYPEYLFTQMTDKEWLKINKLLKKEMGFPLDKVSGNLMRNGFEVGRNTIHKLVNDKVK